MIGGSCGDPPYAFSGGRIRPRSLLFVLLVIAVLSPIHALAVGGDTPEEQHDRIAQIMGRGTILPGDCRLTGGSVTEPVITAEYRCGERSVAIELRHANTVPGALRTDKFDIVVSRGSPPPELLSTIAARVRASEESFDWDLAAQVGGPGVDPVRLLRIAWAIVGVGLAWQYLVIRRRGEVLDRSTPDSSGPDRSSTPWRRSAMTPIVAISVSGAVYLATRLWALTSLPVYVDEAYHIDWARDGLGVHLVPQILTGKWLPVQAMALVMHLPTAPLFGARLASVAMGLITLLACVSIGRGLFSLRDGLLAGAIYTLLPFALFYDRLALADIYMTAFGAWLAYCAIASITRRHRVFPLAMTLCATGAIFSKPTGAVMLAIPALVCVLLVERNERLAYLRATLPTIVAGLILAGLLLANGYGTGSVRLQSVPLPSQPTSDAGGPLVLLRENALKAYDWLAVLLTPSATALTMAAAAWALLGVARRRRAELFLVALLVLAIGPYVVAANFWLPRYVLFATVPVSLLLGRLIGACADAIGRLGDRRSPSIGTLSRLAVSGAILAALAREALPLDGALLDSPEHAPMPEVEHSQYVTAWSSGYGLPELAAFLRQQARDAPINVIRFQETAMLSVGLGVYLAPSDSIHVYSVDLGSDDAARQTLDRSSDRRTFVISDRDVDPAAKGRYIDGAIPVWSYGKLGGQGGIDVWERPATGTP